MNKTISRIFILMTLGILFFNASILAEVRRTKWGNTKGKLKRGYSSHRITSSTSGRRMVYSYVPNSLEKKKKYPLVIAIPDKDKNGREKIAELQRFAEDHQIILVSPDPLSLFTYSQDRMSLKTTAYYLRDVKRYALKKCKLIDDKKIYLLGHQHSADVLINLISQRKTNMKHYTGLILSNTDIPPSGDSGIHFKDTHPLNENKYNLDIYYIVSPNSAFVSYENARRLRDHLREKEYSITYRERFYADNFPTFMIPDIFKWVNSSQKPNDDNMEKRDPSFKTYLTHEFDVLFFGALRLNRIENSSLINAPRYHSKGNQVKFYGVRFRPKRDLEKEDEIIRIKDTYDNIKVIVHTFNNKRELTNVASAAYLGFAQGAKDVLEYQRKVYGKVVRKKTDEQIEEENTIKGYQTYETSFIFLDQYEFHAAAVSIYKSNDTLVGFKMFPTDVDHRDYEVLKHIQLTEKPKAETIESTAHIRRRYPKRRKTEHKEPVKTEPKHKSKDHKPKKTADEVVEPLSVDDTTDSPFGQFRVVE